jgi:hypothetical protein
MLYEIDYRRNAIKRTDRGYYNWRLYPDLEQAKAQAHADAELVYQFRYVIKVAGGYTVCNFDDKFDTFVGEESVYEVLPPTALEGRSLL